MQSADRVTRLQTSLQKRQRKTGLQTSAFQSRHDFNSSVQCSELIYSGRLIINWTVLPADISASISSSKELQALSSTP